MIVKKLETSISVHLLPGMNFFCPSNPTTGGMAYHHTRRCRFWCHLLAIYGHSDSMNVTWTDFCLPSFADLNFIWSLFFLLQFFLLLWTFYCVLSCVYSTSTSTVFNCHVVFSVFLCFYAALLQKEFPLSGQLRSELNQLKQLVD